MTRLQSASCRSRARAQRGAALGVALVILLVVTLLGVGAMALTSTEQQMARNFQELNRAFQAAESGATRALSQRSLFGSHNSTNFTVTGIGTYDAEANVSIGYLASTKPSRMTEVWDPEKVSFHHFSVRSEGTTTKTKARAAVTQGVFVAGAPTGDVLFE